MNKADNLPMSAEEYFNTKNFGTDFDFAEEYANYLLSHHINVLAERKYTREEVLEHLNRLVMMPSSELDKFTDEEEMVTMKWFEQFKK